MNIQEKIDKLMNELGTTLDHLNKLHETKKEKEELRAIIEIHLGYVVFLKELEVELKSHPEKKFGKEFLIKQFSNIHKSCQFVQELVEKESH